MLQQLNFHRSRSRTVKLSVEQLECRLVPSITYATFQSGTWAYNQDNSTWRKISSEKAKVICNTGGNLMFASLSTGTWKYVYGSNRWSRLTNAIAKEIDTFSDTAPLFVSFGSGTFKLSGGAWTKLTGNVANRIEAGGSNLFYATFQTGLAGTYLWNNGVWKKLTPGTPKAIAADSFGLYLSNSTGTHYYWVNSGSWSKVNTKSATKISNENNTVDIYANFETGGTWKSRRGASSWTIVTASAASQMTGAEVGSQDVFVAAYSTGTWKVIDGKWTKIMGATAELLA